MKCDQGAVPLTYLKMVQAVMRCLMDYMQTKISTEADRKNRAATEYPPATMRDSMKGSLPHTVAGCGAAGGTRPLACAGTLHRRQNYRQCVTVLTRVGRSNYGVTDSGFRMMMVEKNQGE